MYEETCYKAPFLKEAIVRLDFSSPVDALASKIPLKLGNAALSRFPIAEPSKGISTELQLSGEGVQQKREEFTKWNYYGLLREKQLTITPVCTFVTYSKYTTYESLRDDFSGILEPLAKTYPDLRGNRLGMRYINSIEIANTDPMDWSSYIDDSLLGLFPRFGAQREVVSRLFHVVEFKHDDLLIKFQFGVPNPDFPAPIRRPVFVLDIDAHIPGLIELSDVADGVERAHAHIQDLYEKSITEELRSKMNE